MVFYKDTKKTETNIGLLVCVIVLLVLLLANFDKCFAPVATLFQSSNDDTKSVSVIEPTPNSSTPISKEGFDTNEPINNLELTERNITIDPVKKTVSVKFERNLTTPVNGYVLILSKYDKNLQHIGNLDVKIVDAVSNTDDEMVVTTTTNATTNAGTNATTTTNAGTSTTPPTTTSLDTDYEYPPICNSSNICQYTFTNVESKDSDGNLFYYRLGIGIITGDTEKSYSPINELRFGSSGSGLQRYFRVDNTLKEQKALLQKLSNLEKLKVAKSAKSTQDLVESQDLDENGEVKYDVDAYMKMLKPYIGNYPDEFTLNQQKLDELSLGKYLNKSLALGSFNIDVDVADIMPKQDDSQ